MCKFTSRITLKCSLVWSISRSFSYVFCNSHGNTGMVHDEKVPIGDTSIYCVSNEERTKNKYDHFIMSNMAEENKL